MQDKTPVSFHGDPKLKELYVARMKAHALADELVHGFYWKNGKGCAVGCLAETGDRPHHALSSQIGIPLSMAYLIDRLFENMPNAISKTFPSRFIETVPVGVDLQPVMDAFLLTLLNDPEQGALKRCNDRTRPAVQAVIELYARRVAGDNPSRAEWKAAAAAADAAAAAAAAAAADADADAAAYAAAAAAARRSEIWKTTRANHFEWQAELLLTLLSAATVKEVAHAG